MTFPPYLRNAKKNPQKHHTCVNLVCVSPSWCFFVWKLQPQAPSEIPQEAAEPWVGGAQSQKLAKKVGWWMMVLKKWQGGVVDLFDGLICWFVWLVDWLNCWWLEDFFSLFRCAEGLFFGVSVYTPNSTHAGGITGGDSNATSTVMESSCFPLMSILAISTQHWLCGRSWGWMKMTCDSMFQNPSLSLEESHFLGNVKAGNKKLLAA